MRIRLQLLLPVLLAALVAGGFLLGGALVGAELREALATIPGLTRERAVEATLRAVLLGGALATAAAVLVGLVVARMIARPLSRVQLQADRLEAAEALTPHATPVAEIQDVARGLSRAADELRDRQGRDMKERSELAALVEAVSEGIMQVDADGRVSRYNRSARDLLGLPVDATGRPAGSLLRNTVLRGIVERAAAGEESGPTEVVLEDRRVLVSVTVQPGRGAVATFVDLTDLRRLEEVRRDFVANASHELKTPLTSIRGYTETLLGAELPPAERRQFLGTIARNAERLQRIVDDLLDLSRLEAGKWQPRSEVVRVGPVAERCWVSLADRAADQEVSFRVIHADDDHVIADASALEQVFANLFDNALRYTPRGGRITVSTRIDPAPPRPDTLDRRPSARGGVDGARCVVEVSDTGSGIPRDALGRIFERFYRVDPARSRAEGGTGLGLSIVKHMIEAMDGAVVASSELGKGTTIRFWLPAPE